MAKNKNVPNGTGYLSVLDEPAFKVGDYEIYGTPNKYDRIARQRNIGFCNKTVYAIDSGLYKVIVYSIEKLFRPKAGEDIVSWLHYGDYSNNPRFEPYYYIYLDTEPLFYELADFLEIAP